MENKKADYELHKFCIENYEYGKCISCPKDSECEDFIKRNGEAPMSNHVFEEPVKRKIVVLNSGGFDSITLMHYLKLIQEEDADLYSLHFLYGTRNEKQQLECVNKVCEKLGVNNKVIQLPLIDWTTSNFFNSGYDSASQYLEYRNLIFLSYAVSYAQSLGADTVYCAFLNIQDYPDTKLDFLRGLNSFLENDNITIDAPFIYDNKMRLGHIAKYLDIKENEYFSCDNPTTKGEPCGDCADCVALQEIRKKLLKNTCNESANMV